MKHHVYEKHTNCKLDYCSICDGGLSVCTVCGCLEGSLATECPGVQCYATRADRIYAGKIDFRNGKWVELPSPHSPTGWRLDAAQKEKP